MLRKNRLYWAGLAMALPMAAKAACPEQAIDLPSLVSDGDLGTESTYCMRTNQSYELSGGVFVKAGSTLYIEPAVTILGSSKDDFLVISQDAKIRAEGTATRPIVMKPKEQLNADGSVRAPNPGDWGGLAINGRAPSNKCASSSCVLEGEGQTGPYGGDNPEDNSGVLRFVRIEYAGGIFSDTNERNGVAFQGVGRGTIVENLQVHRAADDGVEFFGGNVNVRRLVVTGAEDDSIDWTDGYQGMIQFAVVEQIDLAGDNGIEADNRSDNVDATPFSSPVLANLTLRGRGTDVGILMRAGTKGEVHNAVVEGFATCTDSSEANAEHALAGMSCDGAPVDYSVDVYFDYDFFEPVEFAGAVDPSGTNNWQCGWTVGVTGC